MAFPNRRARGKNVSETIKLLKDRLEETGEAEFG